jgi:hypothetical protein
MLAIRLKGQLGSLLMKSTFFDYLGACDVPHPVKRNSFAPECFQWNFSGRGDRKAFYQRRL